MTPSTQSQDIRLQEFIAELNDFAQHAEKTLETAPADSNSQKECFRVFSVQMIAIRGTALQLALPQVAEFAGWGEEIAQRARETESRALVRKSVASLWDALTTVKFLLENPKHESTDEQMILRTRLKATLKSLGGAKPKVDASEIEALLKQRR